MKFGSVDIGEAEGVLLAHSVRAPGVSFSKGHRLTADDVATLRAAGISSVIAVRPDAGDLMEDEAATAIAEAMGRDHLRFAPASTGRINIFATQNGLFRADREIVDRLNRIDPAITLACLADRSDVREGDMVATVKIIPLAVAGADVERAVAVLGEGQAFWLQPYRAHRVGLVATMLPSLKTSVMDKTRAILDARLASSGSRITDELRVAHRADAVAEAIGRLADTNDMVVVFGASAVADGEDVIPAAIRAAGGQVERVGLPVDPGNLLVLGDLAGVPVVGAPGCARSPKENGFDWVLNRIFSGERPDDLALSGLGVGGLLMEIPTRPRPRLGEPAKAELKVAAIILAAGSASRMAASGKHKLLAEFDGVPLVRRAVDQVVQSMADVRVLVTGHRAADILAAIGDLDCPSVHNPDYATGMASSLRVGLAAVRNAADGVLVMLADMPGITAVHLDRMIGTFRAEGGSAIVRAVSNGKRGNPVILPAATFDAIARLTGDIGARPIIERSGLPVVDVDIGPAANVDTDTVEQIEAAGGVLKG